MATISAPNALGILSLRYLRWGSKLFITGLVLQLVPIAHYIVGGAGRPVGDKFYEQVILWFGCPAELAALILMVGGLSLFAIGFCYSTVSRSIDRSVTGREQLALKLCVTGLVAEVLAGALLYLVFDFLVYTNFYFEPHEPERTIWLVAQLAAFSIYFVGVILALGSVKRDVTALLSNR